MTVKNIFSLKRASQNNYKQKKNQKKTSKRKLTFH